MPPTSKLASRSPRRTDSVSSPVSTRASSCRAREGTRTCWPSAQHRGAGQVADGEPVGVGGDQPQPAGLGGQEHAGEDRAGVVARRGPHDLGEGGGQLGAGEGDRLAGGLGEARELVGGQDPQAELGPAGGDAGLVVGDLDLHAAGGQGPHDVGRQPAREDDDAVAAAGDRDLDRDRQLEVGAGEAQLVAGELHPDPGEHGQGRAASGRRPAGGAEGLDEDITLASELHAVARFLPSCCASQRRSGGRGCGLGMTGDRPRSGGVRLSPRDPQDPTGV